MSPMAHLFPDGTIALYGQAYLVAMDVGGKDFTVVSVWLEWPERRTEAIGTVYRTDPGEGVETGSGVKYPLHPTIPCIDFEAETQALVSAVEYSFPPYPVYPRASLVSPADRALNPRGALMADLASQPLVGFPDHPPEWLRDLTRPPPLRSCRIRERDHTVDAAVYAMIDWMITPLPWYRRLWRWARSLFTRN